MSMSSYVRPVVKDYIPEGEVTDADREAAYSRLHKGVTPDYIPAEAPAPAAQTSRERQAERDKRAYAALEASLARQTKEDVVELVGRFLPRVSQYKTWRHLVRYLERLPRVAVQYALIAVAVSRSEEEQAEVFRRSTRPNPTLLEEYLAKVSSSPDEGPAAPAEADDPGEDIPAAQE